MKKKLPGVLHSRSPLAALRQQLPAATVSESARGGGKGAPLQLVLPEALVRELKVRAAGEGTTVRVLVLQALAAAGFPVPADELVDRRRGK